MATTYSIGVTNTTSSEVAFYPVALGLASNYSKIMDEPQVARISNKTAGLDQQELITYRSRRINKVGPDLPVYHPADVLDAVLYSINLQVILRETRDDGVLIDHPFESWLTIKHDVDPIWTKQPSLSQPSWVGKLVLRNIGACFTDEGVERFDDLAKSALIPTND